MRLNKNKVTIFFKNEATIRGQGNENYKSNTRFKRQGARKGSRKDMTTQRLIHQ